MSRLYIREKIIRTVAWILAFMCITTHAYATQEYVGRGSYTGTLDENRSTKVAATEVENYVVLNSYDITEASLSNYY